MPEVSFYLLPTNSGQERDLFVCKLIEKAYRNGEYPYVLTGSETQSQQLDDQLWTFRPGSFIPHQIYRGELPEFEKVILISAKQPADKWRKTIVNLSSRCPDDFMAADRILEILNDNVETKALGRDRYRQYQQAGLEIVTHKM